MATILKNYYSPGILSGTVRNTIGEKVSNVAIRTQDRVQTVKTDRLGNFSITVPAGNQEFVIDETEEFVGRKFKADFTPGQKIQADITIKPQKVLLFYRFKALLYRITK